MPKQQFRVTGTLLDGAPFDRVFFGPNANAIRKYVESHGVQVIRIDRLPTGSIPPKSKSVSSLGRKYPPFVLAMLAVTLLYPVAAALATFGYILIEHEFHVFAIEKFQITALASVVFIQWLSIVILGFCPYSIVMMALFLMHVLYKSPQASR